MGPCEMRWQGVENVGGDTFTRTVFCVFSSLLRNIFDLFYIVLMFSLSLICILLDLYRTYIWVGDKSGFWSIRVGIWYFQTIGLDSEPTKFGKELETIKRTVENWFHRLFSSPWEYFFFKQTPHHWKCFSHNHKKILAHSCTIPLKKQKKVVILNIENFCRESGWIFSAFLKKAIT